jgi:hypothetical protein
MMKRILRRVVVVVAAAAAAADDGLMMLPAAAVGAFSARYTNIQNSFESQSLVARAANYSCTILTTTTHYRNVVVVVVAGCNTGLIRYDASIVARRLLAVVHVE